MSMPIVGNNSITRKRGRTLGDVRSASSGYLHKRCAIHGETKDGELGNRRHWTSAFDLGNMLLLISQHIFLAQFQ